MMPLYGHAAEDAARFTRAALRRARIIRLRARRATRERRDTYYYCRHAIATRRRDERLRHAITDARCSRHFDAATPLIDAAQALATATITPHADYVIAVIARHFAAATPYADFSMPNILRRVAADDATITPMLMPPLCRSAPRRAVR